ncbi:unnamed protein product [Caenorhabditis bovis]|uniref:Uncharacterized protein n=1 Tax=Caenorhabditis bovis TaxID=2654633 RepID=A0A8S1F921_9PELO|nr:unnamed protein product [Caenorhabditis bovis]
MLKWLFNRSLDNDDEFMRSQSARVERQNSSAAENFLFIDLVIGEVESTVVQFENEQEKIRENKRIAERKPDYSWLISNNSLRPKKFLSIQERNRIENACERLKPSEWPSMLEKWKAKVEIASTREKIIEEFIIATHETIQMRKHEPTIGEVLKKFATGRSSSMSAVQSADMGRTNSTRSLAELSFIELQEIV